MWKRGVNSRDVFGDQSQNEKFTLLEFKYNDREFTRAVKNF